MGVGFCLVVSHRGDHVSRTLEILKRHDAEACEIGRVVTAPRQAVVIERDGLIGEQGRFRPLTKRDRRTVR
jgi:phosphoribosylaminoimidazole (AIR) synthetase